MLGIHSCAVVVLLLTSATPAPKPSWVAGQVEILLPKSLVMPEPVTMPEPVAMPEPIAPAGLQPPVSFVTPPNTAENPKAEGSKATADKPTTEKPATNKRPSPEQRESKPELTPLPTRDSGEEEKDDGDLHHIATNKNTDSDMRGGPWTPRFKEIFDKAGMSLNDPANLARIKNHKGPHPQEYHQWVYDQLFEATRVCRSRQECREALTEELHSLARELSTPGTRLNLLVTRSK